MELNVHSPREIRTNRPGLRRTDGKGLVRTGSEASEASEELEHLGGDAGAGADPPVGGGHPNRRGLGGLPVAQAGGQGAVEGPPLFLARLGLGLRGLVNRLILAGISSYLRRPALAARARGIWRRTRASTKSTSFRSPMSASRSV